MFIDTQQMDAKKARNEELPISVVIEILKRLPIRTLLGCRCVCKAWYTMLSEIYFYKPYVAHAPTFLMVQAKGTSVACLANVKMLEPTGDFINSPILAVRFTPVKHNNDHKGREGQSRSMVHTTINYQLGNSCNGLICLTDQFSHEPTAIWNPFMGEYVSVPKSRGRPRDNKLVTGLGFSPSTNMYKVLRVFHEGKSSTVRLAAQIYDIVASRSKWRRIEDAPCEMPSVLPGFFMSSALHWILDYATSPNPNQLICSFDFADERFRYVQPPPAFFCNDKKYHWSNLGILAGSLSVCAADTKGFRPDIEVWVMDEYGVPESWVKKFSIGDPPVDWWDPYRVIRVLNFLGNGQILLSCSHRYVLVYDPGEKAHAAMKALDSPAMFHAVSLVSLKNALGVDGPSALRVKYL